MARHHPLDRVPKAERGGFFRSRAVTTDRTPFNPALTGTGGRWGGNAISLTVSLTQLFR